MKLSVKGVLLGAVADIVATNVLAIPIIMVVDARLIQSAPGTAPSVSAFTEALKSSPGLYLTELVLGSVASVFGGWVAARVARRAEVLNGAVSAVACMGIGVYGMMRYPQSAPLWQHIGFLILSPVLGALGGLIERRQSSHAARQPVQSPTVAGLCTASIASDGRHHHPVCTLAHCRGTPRRRREVCSARSIESLGVSRWCLGRNCLSRRCDRVRTGDAA